MSVSPITVERLYWEEELSQYEISEKLNYTRSYIQKIMDRNGIPKRTRSEALMGHRTSEETRKKISDAHRGRKRSKEAKENMSKSAKKRWESKEEREKQADRLTQDINLKHNLALSYIIGVIEGDGYIIDSSRGYSIELTTIDKEFAEEFKSNLERIGLNPYIYRQERKEENHNDQWICCGYSKKLYGFLKRLTLSEIENSIVNNKEGIINFLRGFFDSEGTVLTRKKRSAQLNVVNTNKELIDLVKRFSSKLGFNMSLSTRYPTDESSQEKTLYILWITKYDEVKRFINTIEPTIKRKRWNNLA